MILQRRPKKPEHYIITIGSPWLINGQPTDATTAADALSEIYDQSTWFPTWVDVVTTTGATYYLQMDAEGATTTREMPAAENDETAAVPLDEEILDRPPLPDEHEAPSPVSSVEKSRTEQGEAPTDTELADIDEPDGKSTRQSHLRMTKTIKIGAAGLAAALLLTLGGVATYSATSEKNPGVEQPSIDQTQEPAIALPEGSTPLTISSRAVIALNGNQLLWLDPHTAEPVAEATTVKHPEQVRALSADTLDVVADGTDQYITYNGTDKPEARQGSVNLRGKTPVITEEKKARVLGETQNAQNIPDKAAVFNGVSGGVAFARAPKDVIYPDHTVTLQGPGEKTTIVKWVQADKDRVVVVWKSDNKTILASHDPKTGKITDRSELKDEDEVSVVAGVVRVGDTQYLNGGALTTICEGGEFVPGGLICPTDTSQWKTPSGAIATDKPATIGTTKYVTTTNEIKELETK